MSSNDGQIIGVRPARDLEYVVDGEHVELRAAAVYMVPHAVRPDTAAELNRLGEARLIRWTDRAGLPGPAGPTGPPAGAGGHTGQRRRRAA